MKKYILIACIMAGTTLFAQDADTTHWKHNFKGSLSFNQAAFSDNWTAGGVSSVGMNAIINYKFGYEKGKHSWNNEMDLLYGFMNNDGQGYRKNNDRIYIDTKYGYSLSPKWKAYGSLNMLTQFAEGYKYDEDAAGQEVAVKISNFLAPGYFTASLGFEYIPKPYFSLRLSPLSPRITIVSDDEVSLNVENNYGVAMGENTRWEVAAMQILADFDKDLNENINLKFRYVLFANYETFTAEEIDHRLDAVLSAKIATYFDVKLTGILVYDYDQDKDIQLSQALGIGFVYTFKNFKESD